LDERHIGLIPCNEHKASQKVISHLAEKIERLVDIERLLTLTRPNTPVASLKKAPSWPAADLRIGIARDESFGFYYPDDLQSFRMAGAELVPINMKSDHALPDIDGLFIGGGFPEAHMEQLENNKSMREAVRDAIENGMPTYAECGGLMYLARQIVWKNRRCKMAGVIPADVIMHDKPVGRGYARFTETEHAPWPHGQSNSAGIPAHEFHYSSLADIDPAFKFSYAYKIGRGHGVDGAHDGVVYKNLLACYLHQRNVSDNQWVSRFTDFVRQKRAIRLRDTD